jgi:CRAL/TRIO domain
MFSRDITQTSLQAKDAKATITASSLCGPFSTNNQRAGDTSIRMTSSDDTTFLDDEPDQYGQRHPVESPELLERKQQEFQFELDTIPDNVKKNVLLAQEKCPQLATDDTFKLMFLRTELFNAKLAAQRYCRYWDQRVEIFGIIKAFQPLTLKDALCDDDVALALGFIQLVPDRHDAMGRALLFVDLSQQDRSKYTRESMARAIWYFIHASLQLDERVQKHGMIFLAWPHHAKFSQFDRAMAKLVLGSIQGTLPVRLSAFHLCQPPSFFKLIFPIVKLFLTNRTKQRLKVHFASTADEIAATLASFGLSRDDLPEQIGGTVNLDVEKWLKQRRSSGL